MSLRDCAYPMLEPSGIMEAGISWISYIIYNLIYPIS